MRLKARRVMAHLAPAWARRAPIVTHAIQKWEAVKEKGQGYHWAMLATPENTMNTPPPTRGSRPSRSTRCPALRTGGKDRNRGQTTQSLATEHRDRGDPRRHVDALRHPVEADRSGRDGQPRLRVLLEVGVQPGQEAHREQHGEGRSEPGRDPFVAQRRGEAALAERFLRRRRPGADVQGSGHSASLITGRGRARAKGLTIR